MWRRREFLVEASRAALGAAVLPGVARSRAGPPLGQDLIADLEQEIPRLMKEALVPGLSIAIIKDAKLFWRRGFGVTDKRSKQPVDNETVFEAASTSKPVFAYAVMKLCVPFGMTASGYLWNAALEAHMAPGHDEKGNPTGSNRKPSRPALARYGMAGGLCTTPTDYARFLIEIIDPQPRDAFRLSRESLQEMIRPHVRRNAESSWALGWEINHTRDGGFLRHGGGNPGYSCFVAASVEHRSGYVIMTNAENSGYTGVIAKLIVGDTLSRFLGGKLRGASE